LKTVADDHGGDMKSQEYVQQELNSRACLQSMLSLSTDDCMRRQQKFKSRIQPHECLRHQGWIEILAAIVAVAAGPRAIANEMRILEGERYAIA
jgi:hypothetical protein